MLNPATILLVVQGIQAALALAPQVEKLAVEAKNWINALFAAGLIPADTQNLIHAHVDDVVRAVLNGTPPPEFTVEPDPAK